MEHFLSVCTELGELDTLLRLQEEHLGISISCGVHPLRITRHYDPEELESQISRREVIALGETGLDRSERGCDPRQREVFRDHLHLGKKYNKPLVVHMRQSSRDVLSLLEERRGEVRGVIHCFTGDVEVARALLDLGFYLSFSGIVTFPEAEEVREVARYVPLDRMLLETDAPYLTPLPFRGERNQPANMRATADLIAELRDVNPVLLSRTTTENFSRLFGVRVERFRTRTGQPAVRDGEPPKIGKPGVL